MEGSKHKKVRISRPKRLAKKTWLELAKENQERILARRGGELLPDSTPIIRAMRLGYTGDETPDMLDADI